MPGSPVLDTLDGYSDINIIGIIMKDFSTFAKKMFHLFNSAIWVIFNSNYNILYTIVALRKAHHFLLYNLYCHTFFAVIV